MVDKQVEALSRENTAVTRADHVVMRGEDDSAAALEHRLVGFVDI
jgi:hypothetical protein